MRTILLTGLLLFAPSLVLSVPDGSAARSAVKLAILDSDDTGYVSPAEAGSVKSVEGHSDFSDLNRDGLLDCKEYQGLTCGALNY